MMLTPCEKRIQTGGWKEDALLHRCEAPIGPRNTWSNAAYALAGFAIYFAAPSNESGLLMAMCVALALGSGVYHAYKSSYFNDLDHVGMYMVFGALAVFGWWANPFAMSLVAFGAAWLGTFVQRNSYAKLDTQVGVFLAITLVPVAWHDWREALVVLGVYSVGYVVQRLDHAHSPLVEKWGHALWHVISAIAIFLTALAIIERRLG